MRDTRLHMFETGTIKLKVHSIKMNQGDGAYEVPVPFHVITHPKGIVVIDGGVAAECATNADEHWGVATTVFHPVLTEQQGCVAQLRSIGIEPEDVTHVVQSHLHLDHTEGGRPVPQCGSSRPAQGDGICLHAGLVFGRGLYSQGLRQAGCELAVPRRRSGRWSRSLRRRRDPDVLHPGHAPGHQSFLVNLPKTGPMLLTMDAAYTLDHWNEKALPGYSTSAVKAVRSVKKLHRIAANTGARVVTGHDPDDWANFKKAPPDYYD